MGEYLTESFPRTQTVRLGNAIKAGKTIDEDQLGPDPQAKEYGVLALRHPLCRIRKV